MDFLVNKDLTEHVSYSSMLLTTLNYNFPAKYLVTGGFNQMSQLLGGLVMMLNIAEQQSQNINLR